MVCTRQSRKFEGDSFDKEWSKFERKNLRCERCNKLLSKLGAVLFHEIIPNDGWLCYHCKNFICFGCFRKVVKVHPGRGHRCTGLKVHCRSCKRSSCVQRFELLAALKGSWLNATDSFESIEDGALWADDNA
jgi:phage FluMu protein Com